MYDMTGIANTAIKQLLLRLNFIQWQKYSSYNYKVVFWRTKNNINVYIISLSQFSSCLRHVISDVIPLRIIQWFAVDFLGIKLRYSNNSDVETHRKHDFLHIRSDLPRLFGSDSFFNACEHFFIIHVFIDARLVCTCKKKFLSDKNAILCVLLGKLYSHFRFVVVTYVLHSSIAFRILSDDSNS